VAIGEFPGLQRRQAKPNLIVKSIANSFRAAFLSGKAARDSPSRKTYLSKIGRGGTEIFRQNGLGEL
jgi:hypothetical protein